LFLDLLGRGIQPSWSSDEDNQPALKLAAKLGLTQTQEYVAATFLPQGGRETDAALSPQLPVD
jgi:hypothetical protein